jgi:hypothetical protein
MVHAHICVRHEFYMNKEVGLGIAGFGNMRSVYCLYIILLLFLLSNL